jgi:hypothetical protein
LWRRAPAAAIGALGLVLAGGSARADEPAPPAPPPPAAILAPAPTPTPAPPAADDDAPVAPIAERELGVLVGIATGSHITPGGLRVSGRFLYQLSDTDWFDGVVAFTFGGDSAACYRDRSDRYTCAHDSLDGFGGELGGGIRRFIGGRDQFRPWLRLGASVRVARFGKDDVTGAAIPVTAAVGVRTRVADRVAVGGEAAIEVGPGWFGHGLGYELEAGFTVGVLTEISLP